jgi:hypothetical protein
MHLLACRFYSNCVHLLYYGCSAELIHIYSILSESTFSSTVQTLAFFRFELFLGYSFMLISQNRNCTSDVFSESLCVIGYIIVCMFVVVVVLVAGDVGCGGCGASSVSFCKWQTTTIPPYCSKCVFKVLPWGIRLGDLECKTEDFTVIPKRLKICIYIYVYIYIYIYIYIYSVVHVLNLSWCGGLNSSVSQKVEVFNLLYSWMHSTPYGVPWLALKG